MSHDPINLNADLGESFGAYTMGNDLALLEVVDSANVACGFHAGDPVVMRRTVRAARERGVSIGAHPSFPDLQGFGRRPMTLSNEELESVLLYQIAALDGIARTEGTRVRHVKPHGAMNNMACVDPNMANVIVRAIRTYDPSLIVLAPALSCLAQAGRDQRMRVVDEIFADRNYTDQGELVSRREANAMVHGAEASLAHVDRMLKERALVSVSGKRLPTPIGSICVHGDGPDAVATAGTLRRELESRGYALRPFDAA